MSARISWLAVVVGATVFGGACSAAESEGEVQLTTASGLANTGGSLPVSTGGMPGLASGGGGGGPIPSTGGTGAAAAGGSTGGGGITGGASGTATCPQFAKPNAYCSGAELGLSCSYPSGTVCECVVSSTGISGSWQCTEAGSNSSTGGDGSD